MSSEFAFDVTAATFESAVIARSRQTPILLDFWADWCGPCKTLRPVLDQLVEEYGGAFLLGAVNTEVEQDLSYAFQVQGIPYCVLVQAGRPVDAFQGVMPEAEIRSFLERAGIAPLDPSSKGAADVAADPGLAALAAARTALMKGDWRAARDALAGFPEDHAELAVAERLRDGFTIFETELDDSPASAAAARGRDLFSAGQPSAAAEAWIESVGLDRAWSGGLARRAIVMVFEVLGVNDAGRELVRELRGRLASLLY